MPTFLIFLFVYKNKYEIKYTFFKKLMPKILIKLKR